MKLHRFTGRGDLCAWPSLEVPGSFCCQPKDHAIHDVDVDPLKLMEGRMLGRPWDVIEVQLGRGRDSHDIELGNPTLRDHGV